MRTRQILISLIVLSVLTACDDHASKLTIPEIVTKPTNFNSYFQLDTSEFHYSDSYHPFYEINNLLKLDNIIDTTIKLEIRLLATKQWDTTYYYRLKLNHNSIWTGEKCKFEYMTLKQFDKTSFTPLNGWKEFESAIIKNDILTTGIENVIIPDYCHFLHPRNFSFQIISPKSMKIINYGAFNAYLNQCDIKQKEFERMTDIMNSLFDKNNSW